MRVTPIYNVLVVFAVVFAARTTHAQPTDSASTKAPASVRVWTTMTPDASIGRAVRATDDSLYIEIDSHVFPLHRHDVLRLDVSAGQLSLERSRWRRARPIAVLGAILVATAAIAVTVAGGFMTTEGPAWAFRTIGIPTVFIAGVVYAMPLKHRDIDWRPVDPRTWMP